MTKQVLADLRSALEPFIGCEIDIDANVGRRRIIPYEGVLEETYPNLFIVRVNGDDDEQERTLSFSYVDLFTGNVVVSLHKDGQVYKLSSGQEA